LGQVNAARSVLGEFGLKIPVVGIAKGRTRKKNEFIGAIPSGFAERTLIKVRDEAHRFAVSYHRRVRSRESIR
jgi:excinuclease ABC subunit C